MLAFPSNQFGAQAPCASSCERAYMLHKLNFNDENSGVVVFDKVVVNGDGASDAYVFLQRTVQNNLPNCAGCMVTWNYEKFLVDADGRAFGRYYPAASPLDMEADIERLLADAGR